MSFDSHTNFGYSTVATAPSPATSGTSLTVQAGDGAKFPTAPFNATVWPAGVQPTSDVAEIVRVTAKSTDTFTITRAQESTSAKSVTTGFQIAATVTAKVITDIETAGLIQYVSAPTGVAATDTANIQAAHDALGSSGGMVLLQPGTYVLSTSSPSLNFTKQIHLKGHGYQNTFLSLDSATGVAIQSTGKYCIFEDFMLENVHATTPTAGAGIQIPTGGATGQDSYNIYNRIWLNGFYINLDQQYGAGWNMSNCLIWQYASTGVKIQNLTNSDAGDMTINGCTFLSNIAAAHKAVVWASGGGLRFINNKVNSSTTAGTGTFGLIVQPSATAATSNILITGNSIENVDTGFIVNTAGGTLKNIVINGNQFSMPTGSTSYICVDINPSSTSKISNLNVFGNIVVGGGYGLNIVNINNMKYGPNVYAGQTTAAINNGGGNTNLLAVGSG